jgi:hypothetical protein
LGYDFPDKTRYVDVGGARRRAGCVKAIQASVRLGYRLLRIEGRVDLRKSPGDLGVVLKTLSRRWGETAHGSISLCSRELSAPLIFYVYQTNGRSVYFCFKGYNAFELRTLPQGKR